jgi:hypothetical protein
MTRISLLEDQKAIFTAQKEELENNRRGIYSREQEAISDALLPFFEGFSPYAYIEVSRSSVYFKADHPDYTYKKELFSLYLKENYNFEDKEKAFTGVDLSYYTSSTKGVDAWELRRLRMLGDLAEIVLNNHDNMVDAVNKAVGTFKEEFADVYRELSLLERAIRDVDNNIAAVKKEEISVKLIKEGIEFDKGVYFRMKFSFEPYIKYIKLVDVSKSGKRAIAEFKYTHGEFVAREENVSVESIINQVLGYSNSIVEKELAN